jgi:hypothetical protein
MANLAGKNIIRSVQPTKDGATYDIVAKYLNGTSGDYSLDEILDLVQGVVDTYVIKTQSNPTSDYTTVVKSTNSTITTTIGKLNTLVGRTSGSFKVGDIILMEEVSDGTKVFDRWISAVDSTDVTLAVLETQVATHHHTINISSSSEKALTGVLDSPTVTLTSVGDPVSVITSVAGTFVTDISLTGGGDTLGLSSTSTSGSGIASHSHTVDSHSHTFKPNTLVSLTASAYTTLSSSKHTPHTHSVVSAAGKSTNGSAFNVVTGISTSATFIKTLTSDTLNTGGTTNLTTNENSGDSLSTSTQSSVSTSSSGDHTHDVEVTSSTKVITSVNYTAPTIRLSVMTSVSYTAVSVVTSYKNSPTSSFISEWGCSVNDSGVLSFTVASENAVTSATTVTGYAKINRVTGVSRQSQSAGSLVVTSSEITSSGTTESSGSHIHAFEHTHAIPSHTHTINSHTHTYVKTIMSETGNAITDLATSSYTPHTHETNVSVASTATDGSVINIVTGGTQTEVVRNLKTSDFSTDTSNPGTDTKHVALIGEITFPELTAPTASVSVSSTEITPAVDGKQTALKSITFTSANFVTTVTSGSIKTSTNIGGN